jgi:hypothetical protein
MSPPSNAGPAEHEQLTQKVFVPEYQLPVRAEIDKQGIFVFVPDHAG